MPEELFEKADEPPKVEKKRKKQVSQATLDALARGREKMRLKREAEKKKKEEAKTEKANVKLEIKTVKEGEKKDVAQKKQYRKTQKQLKKEQEALEKVQAREKEKERQSKIDRFHEAKCRVLEKCANVVIYKQLNAALSNIDEDTICEDDNLKDKLEGMIVSLANQDTFEMRQMVAKHTGKISNASIDAKSQDLSTED